MFDFLATDSVTLRRADPPRPVLINVNMLFGSRDDAFRLDTVPLSVKTAGLNVFTDSTPGLLHAWAQTTRRAWLAQVSFEVATGDGKAVLSVCQWCPARAVKPAPLVTSESRMAAADYRDPLRFTS